MKYFYKKAINHKSDQITCSNLVSSLELGWKQKRYGRMTTFTYHSSLLTFRFEKYKIKIYLHVIHLRLKHHRLKKGSYAWLAEKVIQLVFPSCLSQESHRIGERPRKRSRTLKACLHGGGGPQIGEVTCDGSPHLSCKREQVKMRDYMDRQVTPPKRVTAPTWGPPPLLHVNRPLKLFLVSKQR